MKDRAISQAALTIDGYTLLSNQRCVIKCLVLGGSSTRNKLAREVELTYRTLGFTKSESQSFELEERHKCSRRWDEILAQIP